MMVDSNTQGQNANSQSKESSDLSLGQKLAVLAKLKGLTQEQIAKKCTMSRISVNRFFRSHTEIRAGDLGALLNTLGIDLEEIIDKAIENHLSGGGGSQRN